MPRTNMVVSKWQADWFCQGGRERDVTIIYAYGHFFSLKYDSQVGGHNEGGAGW